MIKLIIFDLDGVLVDAKGIHYNTLNDAIANVAGTSYVITEIEHLTKYDGLKTLQKLHLLTTDKGLPQSTHDDIWKRKQELTIEAITKLPTDARLVELFVALRNAGYRIACCSNSIRRSVVIMLTRLGIVEHMDIILSNEDVRNGKPHPEMYWACMSAMGVMPEETLIVEDSPHGLMAASRSRANVLRVGGPGDVTMQNIESKINKQMASAVPMWQGGNMNILIPMAGAGSRFVQAGYALPKPLIDVEGQPMIQLVVGNLNIDATYIFVVQKEHRLRYNIDMLLKVMYKNCKIIEVDGITQGAACTTLLAKEHIDNDCPLVIANSDQYIEWDSNDFMYKMNEQKLDGGIVTFNATHPKWSYVKVDDLGYVTMVAEKNPISDIATAGVYYWGKGSDYVRYAEQMIAKDIRTNNEFYVCPVFNEAIQDGKRIKHYDVAGMYGLGTPEDLQEYLNRGK